MTTREHKQAPLGGRPAGTLAGEVERVPVARTDQDPRQPRKTMDPNKLAELAANIREHGLQQPIHVRPGAAGRFVVVIGARRLEAFKLLDWEEIPAVIHPGPLDGEELRLLQVSENLLREDVNPMEQALALKECLNGGTASALAAKLGVAVATVTNALSLAEKLPADVQELVRQGAVPGTVARELTRAASDEQKCDLARRYVAGELKTRAEVTAAVRAARTGQATPRLAATGFVCEEAGVKVTVSLPPGGDLAAAEAALRELLKELNRQRGRPVAAFQEYLAAKKAATSAARKAAELQAARDALASHTGTP
jgi:ParB family chromosome partitioning protein